MAKAKGLRFDWYKTIDDPIIDQCIKEVITALAVTRSSKRSSGLTPSQTSERAQEEEVIAKQILSALFHVSANGTGDIQSGVSVPLGNSAYKKPEPNTKPDPKKLPFSVTFVKSIYNTLLNELGWIIEKKGSEYGGFTRIKPTDKLIKQFGDAIYAWCPQTTTAFTESVILRDTKENKKQELPLPQTHDVDGFQEQLYLYNSFIKDQCFCLDLEDSQFLTLVSVMNKDQARRDPLHLSKVQLTRIFSQGDINKGGRFYRGWWQSVPSIYRPHIVINGEKTVEIDYSAVAFKILYEEAGVELDMKDDPYDIGLPEWIGKDDPRRPLIKTFMTALINDEAGTFKLYPDEQKELGITHAELKQLIYTKHGEIAEYLKAGHGLRAQFTDSQVAIQIMLGMADKGIPVLPIHDSFIVSHKHELELKKAMDLSFQIHCGPDAQVTVDLPRNLEHFGLSKTKFREEICKNPVDLTDTQVVGEQHSSTAIMNRYYLSWLEYRKVKAMVEKYKRYREQHRWNRL